MDNPAQAANFVRTVKRHPPKGSINISRKKPKIEAYDADLPDFVFNLKLKKTTEVPTEE